MGLTVAYSIIPCLQEMCAVHWLGCDIGGAKELGMIYFPTNWGAKEQGSWLFAVNQDHKPL